VGDCVGVSDGEGDGVSVGVGEGVSVGVGDGVSVGVGEGVSVGVGDGLSLGEGDGVSVGDGEGVGVCVGLGVGFGSGPGGGGSGGGTPRGKNATCMGSGDDAVPADGVVFFAVLVVPVADGESEGDGRRAGTSAITRSGGPGGRWAGPAIRMRAIAPTSEAAPPYRSRGRASSSPNQIRKPPISPRPAVMTISCPALNASPGSRRR